MKILMVNKFYYIKGGSETYYFALKKKLESKGHEVVDFSMLDEKNFESSYSKFFVNNIDYDASSGILDKIRMAKKIIYSSEAKKKFEQLILSERPDIIHLHIFQHQISPSILQIVKKYNIATVYTAHDLKMICLNYKMMHHGKICEDCRDGKYWKCLKNKCVKNSFIKSGINMVEGYLHRWLKSYDAVDVIITPSAFYKKKFEEFGIDEKKIIHIPNFSVEKKIAINISDDAKKYYLYFGRISEEKGIFTLIQAVKKTGINLYIVGTGPLKESIQEYVKNNILTNVHILGFISGQELVDYVGNAKAVILPSEWYENGPYSAIEALREGRPIIGANIGGIPEIIDGNGYLFDSGDIDSLCIAIEKFEKLNKNEYAFMEKKSMEIYEDKYTSEANYYRLMQVYHRALSLKSRVGLGENK